MRSPVCRQLDSMGFQSGQEFVVAVREADAIGASLLLGDRDARLTIRRLRDAVGEVSNTVGCARTCMPSSRRCRMLPNRPATCP